MKHLIVVGLLVVCGFTRAQSPADSLFRHATQLAAKEQYTEAVELVAMLRNDYPENKDYSFYLAQLYIWMETFEEARKLLLSETAAEQLSATGLDLLIQAETGVNDTQNAVAHADAGILRFPEQSSRFRLLKGMAQMHGNLPDDAMETLSVIPKNDTNYDAAQYIINQLLKRRKNSIATGYLLTVFDHSAFDPQHAAFLEYSRKFKQHSQIFRVNYGHLFGQSSLQLETDAYIPLNKTRYIYVNAGVSDKLSVFPQFRAGGELYSEHKRFTASAGMRYLHFDPANRPVLLTGHLAVIRRSWLVNYRPFVVFFADKTLASHLVYVRKSLERTESYLQLDLQYGTLPYFFYTSEVWSRLRAYRAGIQAKIRFQSNWFAQPAIMYEWEEYTPDSFRNRFTFQLILSHRF